MEGLEDVKKELEAKRQALALELQSAMGQVVGIENDLQRVDDALRALTKKTKSRGRSKKSAPAVDEGATHIHLDERGSSPVGGGAFYSGTPLGTSTPHGEGRFGHRADEVAGGYERRSG